MFTTATAVNTIVATDSATTQKIVVPKTPGTETIPATRRTMVDTEMPSSKMAAIIKTAFKVDIKAYLVAVYRKTFRLLQILESSNL
jgi:hypothetical protein